jgi:hypothetical protein
VANIIGIGYHRVPNEIERSEFPEMAGVICSNVAIASLLVR